MTIQTTKSWKVKLCTQETEDQDFWICVCGNTPVQQGFYPCNRAGVLVEPTPENWPEPLYRCDRCGRIIDQGTLEFVRNESDQAHR